MRQEYRFYQVDVFGAEPLRGNPLAVVMGADGLADRQMAALAAWTNLSETTFLLRPQHPEADYRVRIFTPQRELPFAGHPTLGSCHAWLRAGGVKRGEAVVQECQAGLVRIRQDGELLSFAAPKLVRTGPLEPAVLERARRALGLAADDVVASHWIDNGPGWLGLRLASREAVLAVRPDYTGLDGPVGIVGPWSAADGAEAQFEVRAFIPGGYEDPVTGSLNASLAQWLIGDGVAPASYVASQGTALGRAGRVHVRQEGGDFWIGGAVATCVTGTITL
ncbi:MAG: PhzF family phenazine biosynthesis protein [Acetobacteraceae bacterium]|nr:PhzF family phenazine biosynthesis protein [Acetobacteraceae bacterium]